MSATRRGPPALAVGILAAASLVVGIAAVQAGGDPAENGPETWTFDAHQKAMRAAEFDHFHHASIKGLEIPCTRCHHTSKGTDVEAGCGDCHGVTAADGVPDIKSASHTLCVRCHVQANAKPGARPAPYKCVGCHKGAPPPK